MAALFAVAMPAMLEVWRLGVSSPDQQITIQQTSDLASGQWTVAAGGTVDRQGSTLTARYPADGNATFYRVSTP